MLSFHPYRRRSQPDARPAWLSSTALLLIVGLMAAGCGTKRGQAPAGNTPQEVTQQIDKQIAEIQANPNLPPAAKQSMIAGLENAKRQAQASGEQNKPK